MKFLQELKRRNVIRVGAAYLVASWLLLQIVDVVGPILSFPETLARYLLFLLIIGMIPALIFAWVFEWTPEGVKRESEVDRSRSVTPETGRKIDRVIIVTLAIAVSLLLFDKLIVRDHPVVAEPIVTAERSESVMPDPAQGARRSVAVLPFAVMSSGPDDDYFTDGLTEEIINALAQLPELLVTARTSAFHFKGANLPVQEIASTLGVEHIVEGSVRRAGERLRITAQLIRAEDGFHLWSESYDRHTADTFAVQMDIAEKVAAALDVLLDEKSRVRMRESGVRNVEAYISYQKGIEYHHEAHLEGIDFPLLREGNRYFEEAIALAPDFSAAYLYHSDLYSHILMTEASGMLDGNVSRADVETAPAELARDYGNAVRYAKNPGQRLVAELDRALLLGEWNGLSALSEYSLAASGCEISPWSYLAATPFGQAQLVLDSHSQKAICDPIMTRVWIHIVGAYIWLGFPDQALQAAVKPWSAGNEQRLTWHMSVAKAQAEGVTSARQFVNAEIRSEPVRLLNLAVLEAMEGNRETARDLTSRYLAAAGPDDGMALVLTAQQGDRNEANRLAALIDQRPFGHMALLIAIYTCACGAPFDLDATPVFKQLFAQSGFNWPPQSPITYPLKDW